MRTVAISYRDGVYSISFYEALQCDHSGDVSFTNWEDIGLIVSNWLVKGEKP